MNFPSISLKHKLTLVMMLTGCIGLALATMAISIFDSRDHSGRLERDLGVHAAVVGASCATALEGDDREALEQALGAFARSPRVLAARVYGLDGNPAGDYHAADAGLTPASVLPERPLTEHSSHSTGSWLETVVPIRFQGEQVGTIYVRARPTGLSAVLSRYSPITWAPSVVRCFLRSCWHAGCRTP